MEARKSGLVQLDLSQVQLQVDPRFTREHIRSLLREPFNTARSSISTSLTALTIKNNYYLSYRPLQESEAFRVLVLDAGDKGEPIRCSLKHVSWASSPLYAALSYAWGDSTDRIAIMVDGQHYRITHSLFTALQEFRHVEKRTVLWADALCIDQNIIERNEQVAIMARIYSSATTTLIWLGGLMDNAILPNPMSVNADLLAFQIPGSSLDSDVLAFRVLNIAAHYYDVPNISRHTPKSRKELEDHLLNRFEHRVSLLDIRNALLNLVSRQWFHRAWVLQELAVSRTAWLCCGNQSTPWIDNIEPLFDSLFFLLEVRTDGTYDGPAHHVSKMAATRRRYHQNDGLLLGDLLSDTLAYSSSDPRDKVFALLNLCQPPSHRDFAQQENRLTANYTITPREAFTHVVVSLFRGKEPEYLKFTILSIASDTSAGRYYKELPSWAPDFSASATNIFKLNKMHKVFSVSTNSRIAVDFNLHSTTPTMFLRGSLIDSICSIQHSRTGDDEIWHRNNHEFAHKTAICPSGENPGDVWWRLGVMDFAIGSHGVQAKASKAFGSFYLDSRLLSEASVDKDTLGESELQDYHDLYLINRVGLQSRVDICRTEKGYLGWAPQKAKVGDRICIFTGALAPFLLRRHTKGHYEAIAEMYVHGIMHGEALSWPNIEWAKIALR